jgi:hypothetical protein
LSVSPPRTNCPSICVAFFAGLFTHSAVHCLHSVYSSDRCQCFKPTIVNHMVFVACFLFIHPSLFFSVSPSLFLCAYFLSITVSLSFSFFSCLCLCLCLFRPVSISLPRPPPPPPHALLHFVLLQQLLTLSVWHLCGR